MEAGWKRGVIEVKAQPPDNRKIKLQSLEGEERIRHARKALDYGGPGPKISIRSV